MGKAHYTEEVNITSRHGMERKCTCLMGAYLSIGAIGTNFDGINEVVSAVILCMTRSSFEDARAVTRFPRFIAAA